MIENTSKNVYKPIALSSTIGDTKIITSFKKIPLGEVVIPNQHANSNNVPTEQDNNDDPQSEPISIAADSDNHSVAATADLSQAKLILEAALLSSNEPLQLVDLKKLFDQELSTDIIRKLLDDLKTDWADRAVELTPVASGWRFRVKPEFAQFVHRMNPEKPPRYSRAVMETLAIIAYRQPATRGDVEQIRGVAVSTQIIKALEERNWIEAVGHREVPGRPALYATTKRFLDDLNLRSLEELPPLEELQATLNITTTDVAQTANASASIEENVNEVEAENDAVESVSVISDSDEIENKAANVEEAITEVDSETIEAAPAETSNDINTNDAEKTYPIPPTAE